MVMTSSHHPQHHGHHLILGSLFSSSLDVTHASPEAKARPNEKNRCNSSSSGSSHLVLDKDEQEQEEEAGSKECVRNDVCIAHTHAHAQRTGTELLEWT